MPTQLSQWFPGCLLHPWAGWTKGWALKGAVSAAVSSAGCPVTLADESRTLLSADFCLGPRGDIRVTHSPGEAEQGAWSEPSCAWGLEGNASLPGWASTHPGYFWHLENLSRVP